MTLGVNARRSFVTRLLPVLVGLAPALPKAMAGVPGGAGGRADSSAAVQQAYDDIQLLEPMVYLALTNEQAAAILQRLPEVQAAVAAIKAAEDAYYTEVHQALLAMEQAMLRGDPVDERVRQTIADAGQRSGRARERGLRELNSQLDAITQLLTDQQRAYIEPQAAYEARHAQERQRRRQRAEALRLALADLGQWVRNADAATYPQEVGQHIQNVVQTAYAEADAATVNAVQQNLYRLYELVRRQNNQEFAAFRRQLNQQVRTALFPPGAEQAPEQPFVISEPDWRELWQHPRAAALLTELVQNRTAAATEGATR